MYASHICRVLYISTFLTHYLTLLLLAMFKIELENNSTSRGDQTHLISLDVFTHICGN